VKEKTNTQGKKEANKGKPQQPTRKPPRSAAVTVTAKEGLSYADILRQAREKISLHELGIEASKIRKGINGGLIIEIPGNNGVQKANDLANKLKEILPDDVRINRPTIRSDMRIVGLDESITKEEIRSRIADLGGCNEDEIKVGEIRWRPNGLGNIWIQCPLCVANTIMKTGKIKVGWTVARAEILTPRPLQCYRCWEIGHVRYSCTSSTDRSQHCYKCGSSTHRALECVATAPKCIICEEKGLSSNHRLGSPVCNMIKNTTR
ncbi:hypothetical protein EAG_00500, partial [Camponotus floridanus]